MDEVNSTDRDSVDFHCIIILISMVFGVLLLLYQTRFQKILQHIRKSLKPSPLEVFSNQYSNKW